MSKANFHIFTYMFRPVNESPSDLFADEFKTVDVKDSINRKQEILANILDDFASQSSGENTQHFTYGNDDFYHKVYIQRGGIYVMRIANNKQTKMERNFDVTYEEDNPSCVVIIDNRNDRQIIAIESNKAFNNVGKVAAIIQTTWRLCLIKHRLTVDIGAKYHVAEFWNINKVYAESQGIDYVVFPFAYPNLPAVSDLMGNLMKEVAKNTNSEPTLKLKGQNNESVRLSENDLMIVNAIKACAASGRPILIKPRNMTVKKVGMKNPVIESLPKSLLEELGDKKKIERRFMDVVKFLNNIKLCYD